MTLSPTQIDLSRLPAPEFLAAVDFEAEFEAMKSDLIDHMPELAAVLALESEPIVKLLQAFAYRMMVKTAEYNEQTRNNLLAFAVGAQLDHIGVTYHRTVRLVVQQEDLTTEPPTPEILEDDESYRRRIQLGPEGTTTAGPIGSYKFHALSASPDVKDARPSSPDAGQVLVTILSAQGDGAANAPLISIVESALNDEDVRPLTDQVTVQSANIIHYIVRADLTLYDGPDANIVRNNSISALEQYMRNNHILGNDITISGLHAALHQEGVQNVELIAPAASIIVDGDSAAYCTQITVNVAGRDA